MPTATNQLPRRPERGTNDPTTYRPSDTYSVVRIIACRINWLTGNSQWTCHPEKRGTWTNREAAYNLAQSCRGLLVMGSGLVDLEDGLTQ